MLNRNRVGGYLLPGMAIGLVVLTVACVALWKAASHERTERAIVEGQFKSFQTEVKRLGDAQKARNDATIKEREQINATAIKTLQSRYSDLDARYARLRSQPANPGSGGLPPIPDATRPTDDASRDNRLLEVLRHADQQTAQLIELQSWIKAQKP